MSSEQSDDAMWHAITSDRHDCGGIVYVVGDDERRFCATCQEVLD